MQTAKGFTLIELLVVIGILAVLAAATILVINPAELFAQGRDSSRISDLQVVNSAISLYLADVDNPDLGAEAAGGRCMADPGALNAPFEAGAADTCGSIVTSRAIDGAGWVDIVFTDMTSRPFGALPIDPRNDDEVALCNGGAPNACYFYAYKNSGTEWKVAGRLESEKYRVQMSDDGGIRSTCVTFLENTCYFEAGTNLGL
ncbi:MAG: type II secretion system protein [Candidatus Colwellbacteria bacterium]|nr:type II secretion system protein [Candidatus Colwellbacteria bacterium]